jgi:hypothetical protein
MMTHFRLREPRIADDDRSRAGGRAWETWYAGLHEVSALVSRKRVVRAKHYIDRQFVEPVPLESRPPSRTTRATGSASRSTDADSDENEQDRGSRRGTSPARLWACSHG